ncbi:hypothetical protein CTI12_AA362720 [Artemisia annua]|uniref:Uncharacterized protein n=1 Tax=Artemisia annua TaxID=35608 RepID=A0A2U1MLH9_ARTAN|nr:hypothetical protein CTI12_AA362720 [Artemisia annua]
MRKRKHPSNIPLVRGVANKRPVHVPNMHQPHINLHGPFGDVSDLNKHGSAEDELHGVSHCGDKSVFGHDDSTSAEQNPHEPLRPVVKNTGYDRKFGKEKITSSVLHCVEDAGPYTLGPTSRNPVHGFQTYENTLFQARGSILLNIKAAGLAYTDGDQSHELEKTMHPLTSKGNLCKRKASMPGHSVMLQGKRRRGAHTEKPQRNIGNGEANSHYANEICYLYTDDAAVHREGHVAMANPAATQGMHYSQTQVAMCTDHEPDNTPLTSTQFPTCQSVEDQLVNPYVQGHLPTMQSDNGPVLDSDTNYSNGMNGHLFHLQNGQENDSDGAASNFMLQPAMPDPAIINNVAGPSAYREEEQRMNFQTGSGRAQQNSRRRHSNHASRTTLNRQGVSSTYIDIGDADWRCHYCGAVFWFGERLKSSTGSRIRYSRCCGEGKVHLQQERDPPDSIK